MQSKPKRSENAYVYMSFPPSASARPTNGCSASTRERFVEALNGSRQCTERKVTTFFYNYEHFSPTNYQNVNISCATVAQYNRAKIMPL